MLLDTHALLWWLLDDERLPASARREIEEPGNEILVSSASGWEIATKHRLGKLGLEAWEPASLPSLIARNGFDVLPVSLEHALAAGALAGAHKDPFDRMLIAQSRLEGIPLVSNDAVFGSYDVRLVW
jgi:PIN domain nuclease of toxin-antitoxin system